MLFGAGAVALGFVVMLGATAWRHGHEHRDAGPDLVKTDSRVLAKFDGRRLRVSPVTVPAGIVQITFEDTSGDPTGADVELAYEARSDTGLDIIAGPGGRPRLLLCANRYALAVLVGGTEAARTPLDVTGSSRDCTLSAP